MSSFTEELRKPLYAAMTDAEAAAELNALDKTSIHSRFGSYRTLATLLTESEYNVLVSVLDANAAGSRLVADMVRMLTLPGDDRGNGGGIDLGANAVRAWIDALRPAIASALGGENAATAADVLCNKLKSYAESPTSTAELLGATWTITESDVHNWRMETSNG
ncbi:MAG: hypothetical protein LLG00_12655 [Planctomycetaceae bacterium]|nr:hypothetical protein [Planctomycetaceae bacterium]